MESEKTESSGDNPRPSQSSQPSQPSQPSQVPAAAAAAAAADPPISRDFEPAAESQRPRSPTLSPNGRGRARASTTGAATAARSSLQEEFRSPQRSNTTNFRSPQRRGTMTDEATGLNLEPTTTLRRRNTSRMSVGSGLRPTRTNASRRSNFTLAGPDDNAALRAAHANFVHPGYADLNPAYEQPANTKPVWSLAKPLPRVVRPGMVPTLSEVGQIRNQMPGENTANQGLAVDPEDLEKGKIQKTLDPSKLSAQLKDARAQREHNFLQRHTGNTRTRQSRSSRLQSVSRTGSRVSSRRPKRTGTWAPDQGVAPLEEEDEEGDDDDEDEKEGDIDGAERPSTAQGRPSIGQSPATLQPIREGANEPAYEPDSAFPDYNYDMDDAASLTTLGDGDMDGKELEPYVENIIEEEVHNHHTSWSVVRTHHREFLGEILGCIIQLSVGFSADLAVTCAASGNPNTTAWAWGFATMCGIYVCGGISGAHFNPVITIVLYIFRGFPKKKMPEYFLAQFLAAFISAYIAYGLYLSSIHHYLSTNDASGIIDSFVTNQRYTYIDACTAFFNEFYGTLILVVVVFALGDDANAPPGAGMNAFIVGLTVTLNTMVFAFQTGAALNPTRDFGPRLALLSLGYGKELFTNPYWFYGPWAGALLGGCVGGALYDIAIFTGGESPINYPWTRTRRAAHKSKKRWMWRLHLSKEKPGDEDAPLPDAEFANPELGY